MLRTAQWVEEPAHIVPTNCQSRGGLALAAGRHSYCREGLKEAVVSLLGRTYQLLWESEKCNLQIYSSRISEQIIGYKAQRH